MVHEWSIYQCKYSKGGRPLHLWNMITRVSIVAQNRTVVVSDCQQLSYSGLRSPRRSCSFYLFLMMLNFLLASNRVRLIELVTLFDAILTSRQTREKLQCLYENLMSNNLRSTAVLEKIWIVNESFTPKNSTEKIKGVTCARRPRTTF